MIWLYIAWSFLPLPLVPTMRYNIFRKHGWTACRQGFPQTETAKQSDERKLIQITNKVPSFIVEKKSAFLPAVQMSCGPRPKCNYLGRSAWIHLFSMLDECARVGYSGKINIQICITGRRGKASCAPRFVRLVDLFLSRGTSRPTSVRRTLISRNRASSSTKCTKMHLQRCNYASMRMEERERRYMNECFLFFKDCLAH